MTRRCWTYQDGVACTMVIVHAEGDETTWECEDCGFQEHLKDRCQTCHGRQYLPVPMTVDGSTYWRVRGIRADITCPTCEGFGRV